jgi:hypothetical protein
VGSKKWKRQMNIEQYILSRYSLVNNEVIGPRCVVRGTPMVNGYLGTGVRFEGKIRRVLMHRMVFLLAHGYLPETVDHINGNRADNRIENLRAANKRQQQGNRNSRGYTIRTKRYTKPRYEAVCDHQYLGVFDTAEDAKAAYHAARKLAFGDYAKSV